MELKSTINDKDKKVEVEFADDIRKRRIITFCLLIIYVPLIVCVDFLFNSKLIFAFIIIGYLPFLIWYSTKWVNAVCPRCHKRFFTGIIANPFTSKCVHCAMTISRKR